MTAKEYRLKAKEACKPNSGILALIFFIYDLIIGACGGTSAIGFGAVALIFLTGPLTLGIIQCIEDNLNHQSVQVETLFSQFSRVLQSCVVTLLMGLYITLWSMLFVIPGIIKSYSYAMTYYIHKDNPELKAKECITKSREMMNGHKAELFCLELSYIGWILLSFLTFGILLFWVMPKMETAKYMFYQNIKGGDAVEAEAVQEEAKEEE